MNGQKTIFYILFALLLETESTSTPVIQTSTGPVQGEVLKTIVTSVEYSSFKGIPYAEPPLGYLRFKPPIPKQPWTKVLKATVEGSNCIQKDFVYDTTFTGSEDCLFLNVYTPELKFQNSNASLLPVMIWIHGGSFKSGYGNSSLYGPDFIIEENVVLVTFNYRLGPLGFLNLNHENATGNAGLKDQNLVLRWVHANIANFGGNPNNVTIFGQSAGGVAVDLHSLSDMSKDLFHRSIAMSASPLCPWGFHTTDAAVKQAYALGKKLGQSSNEQELLNTLYEAPAIEMIKKASEMGMIDPPFKPSIENTQVAVDQEKFLTECSYWKYVSGNFYKVPHLTGFTSEETLLFASKLESILDMVSFSSNVLKSFPKSSPIPLPLTNKIASTIASGTTNVANNTVMDLIYETSDLLFIAGIDLKRHLINEHSDYPVYYYRFSYKTPHTLHKLLYDIDLNGTAHGDDLAYPFHMTVANLPLNSSDSTFISRKRMTRLWTNFAKYSNPTPHGEKDSLLQGITWPDASEENNYLEFNENLEVKKNPVSANVKLIKVANLAILPIQTGCVSDLMKKISALNPFASKSKTSDRKHLLDITKPFKSAFSKIFR